MVYELIACMQLDRQEDSMASHNYHRFEAHCYDTASSFQTVWHPLTKDTSSSKIQYNCGDILYISIVYTVLSNILIIKINAQHNALSKAIKTRFKIEIIYCDVSS